MIIIACVDDNFGLMFNLRRQSKDREVTKRICEITKGEKLLISEYSKSLFEDCNVCVDNMFLEKADKGDFLFIEDTNNIDFNKVEKIILFFWNRVYPCDLVLDIPKGYKEVYSKEFPGFSHDIIREVHYEKVD